jgi:hypothetical protein
VRHLRAAIGGALLLVALAGAALAPLPHPGGPAVVAAATPAPSAGTGDTRSSGEAPGFVGAPLVAIFAVLALGAIAAAATIAYVRLTGGPGGPGNPGRDGGAPSEPR